MTQMLETYTLVNHQSEAWPVELFECHSMSLRSSPQSLEYLLLVKITLPCS